MKWDARRLAKCAGVAGGSRPHGKRYRMYHEAILDSGTDYRRALRGRGRALFDHVHLRTRQHVSAARVRTPLAPWRPRSSRFSSRLGGRSRDEWQPTGGMGR